MAVAVAYLAAGRHARTHDVYGDVDPGQRRRAREFYGTSWIVAVTVINLIHEPRSIRHTIHASPLPTTIRLGQV